MAQWLSSARRATAAIASAAANRGHASVGYVAVVRKAVGGVCDAPAASLRLGRRRHALLHGGAFHSHVSSRALASGGGGGGTAKESLQTHHSASPRAAASNGRAEAYQRIDPVEHGECSPAASCACRCACRQRLIPVRLALAHEWAMSNKGSELEWVCK